MNVKNETIILRLQFQIYNDCKKKNDFLRNYSTLKVPTYTYFTTSTKLMSYKCVQLKYRIETRYGWVNLYIPEKYTSVFPSVVWVWGRIKKKPLKAVRRTIFQPSNDQCWNLTTDDKTTKKCRNTTNRSRWRPTKTRK